MTKNSIFKFLLSSGVQKRSFYAALVVGTILNLINQGDVLWSGGGINFLKLVLTYLVPYCVATYGAMAVHDRSTGG